MPSWKEGLDLGASKAPTREHWKRNGAKVTQKPGQLSSIWGCEEPPTPPPLQPMYEKSDPRNSGVLIDPNKVQNHTLYYMEKVWGSQTGSVWK